MTTRPRHRRCLVFLILTVAGLSAACAQRAPDAPAESAGAGAAAGAFARMFPDWYEPIAPARLIGAVHTVGSKGLSVFFLPSPAGHILIDGGLPETAPLVLSNIRALGYDPKDVRILLNTHAHFDHSGGLATLKEATGARLLASAGDRSALEGGFYLGYETRAEFAAPPVVVDQIVTDGEVVRLGPLALTAAITPGHTRGCTSWRLRVEEGGEVFDAVVFCSVSVAANRLFGPPQYPGIVADYKRTLARLRGWQIDVFLSNHAQFYQQDARLARLRQGERLAFVDRAAFPAFIEGADREFRAALKSQQPR